MAAAFKAPILPVAITGTETIKGHWWFLKRHRVVITIGEPFILTTDDKPDKDALGEYGNQIMKAIAKLLPSHRQGVHGMEQ